MHLGLALPQFDYSIPGEDPLRWPSVVRWAQRAEASGFDAVWLADHLFLPLNKYGGPDRPYEGFDPFVALAGIAAATERVDLGTLVAAAPFRPPAVVAKAAAAIDRLSGGRFTLGLGAGWLEREFIAAGIPFLTARERIEHLAEAVQIVKGLAGGGPLRFAGRYGSVDGAPNRPAPGRDVPVWIGGKGGPRLASVIARYADGWNTFWRWSVAEYTEQFGILQRACEAIGRDPSSVALSVGLTTLVGESAADLRKRYEFLVESAPPGTMGSESFEEFRVGRLVGTVDEVGDQLAEWRDAGVAQVICCVGAVPFAVAADDDLVFAASARWKDTRDG